MTAATSPATRAVPLPVDAHVHFHGMQRVAPTLDAAADNFAALSAGGATRGMLLLAQSARERVFEQLAAAGSAGAWRLTVVPGEAQSLLGRSRERSIVIVCGRQIRCELGLEVLALGTTECYPAERPLDETIDRVRGDGALAVVPWGFGKWSGRAGRVIRDLFHRRAPASVFAGDNGGRLDFLGPPKLLAQARAAGFRVLPGTDPFPFARDFLRVGAFGFFAELEFDPAAPWAALRRWLEDGASQPRPYGRALGPLRFAYNQGRIQVHNRLLQRTAG